jgi:hypothetical protein
VAIRSCDRKQNYSDLRARTERQERWRDEQVQRIVGLQRERHLHSFSTRSATVVVLRSAATRGAGSGDIGIAA